MISFDNTEVAFHYKTNRDLNRSYFLFKVLSYPSLVKLTNFTLKSALNLGIPINFIVKPTVYKQFVGGTTIAECVPVVRLLEKYKVRAILDYSVEGGTEEKHIIATLEETLRTIHNAARETNIPFAVFKPTAFGNLERLHELPADHPEVQTYYDRVDQLCRTAHEKGLPIMIDAEDSWYQGFVDTVVTTMMERYNKHKAIVFNTLQMYRHDRLEFLKTSIAAARKGGYFYGVKFVRGAYMEKERARALKMGYPSPIQPDKESTDKAFDDALEFSVKNTDITTIFCGTHNERSCQWLTELMEKHQLAKDDNRIWFSQLFGMSDHISFNLAEQGYNVAKYLPYGPVRSVMPYLFRRAEENTSIAGQTGRELRLAAAEMKRRKA